MAGGGSKSLRSRHGKPYKSLSYHVTQAYPAYPKLLPGLNRSVSKKQPILWDDSSCSGGYGIIPQV